MAKTNLGLVEHAEKWVGQVYWYGTYCQSCTESRLNAKKKQYPSPVSYTHLIGICTLPTVQAPTVILNLQAGPTPK